MNLWHAIILGIVEGITEFLPISSTGHLILTAKILGLAQSEFVKSFEIVIQLGAITAVVALYWRKIFTDRSLIVKLFVAFLPTAIIGLIAYKLIKNYLLGSISVVLWSLLLGGLFIIIFEKFYRENKSEETLAVITYKQALIIGFFQSIAVVPGLSRAASTIIGGLIVGLRRKTIVEFSFLLAVPTMLAATCFDLYKNVGSFSVNDVAPLMIGFIVSFIIAIIFIKLLLSFIQKRTFIIFGYYRLLIALIFWLFLF